MTMEKVGKMGGGVEQKLPVMAQFLFLNVGMEGMAWKVLLQIVARFCYFSSFLDCSKYLPWSIDNVYVHSLPSHEFHVFRLENRKEEEQKEEVPVFIDDSCWEINIEWKEKEQQKCFWEKAHIFHHFLLSLYQLLNSPRSNYSTEHPMCQYIFFLLTKLPFLSSSHSCSLCDLVNSSQLPFYTFPRIIWGNNNNNNNEEEEDFEDFENYEILEDIEFVQNYYRNEFSSLSSSVNVKNKLWKMMMDGLIKMEKKQGNKGNKGNKGNFISLTYLEVQQEILKNFPFMKFPSKLVMKKIQSIRHSIPKLWKGPEQSMWNLWFLTLLYKAPFVPVPTDIHTKLKICFLFEEIGSTPKAVLKTSKNENQENQKYYEYSFVDFSERKQNQNRSIRLCPTEHPCIRTMKFISEEK